MKNKLLIALTALALTACTSNLHALTKTRAFAQAATTVAHTAANYARQNKLKTAGMVIGSAIAVDALQAGVRYLYHISPWHQAKIHAAKTALDTDSLEERSKKAIYGKASSADRDQKRADWESAATKRAQSKNIYNKLLLFNLRTASLSIRLYDSFKKFERKNRKPA